MHGPVRYTGQAAIARDIANLSAAMDAAGVEDGSCRSSRPPAASPSSSTSTTGASRRRSWAIAEALREEYRAIVDAGLMLQVDDAFIPFMYDVLVPPGTLADYHAWARPRIAALNHALEGIPPERVRYHVCWGSWNGPHTNDIPLRDVLDLMFSVNAGTYLFEAANPRHEHEWRVWEDVELPEGKRLIAGGHLARDERRRAPRARRGAPCADRPARRPGERRGLDRLRLRPGSLPAAHAPDDPVGEAAGAGRGRRAGVADARGGEVVTGRSRPASR